jgi:hypothetical protein
MNLDKQKVVIRLFLQTIYRRFFFGLFYHRDTVLTRLLGNFTFNPIAKVPWAAISKEPGRYLAEGSLPAGVDLVEPTKLRADDVATLWSYWRDSQKVNERPVYFLEAVAKDVRRHGTGGKWPKRKVKSQVSGKKDKGKGKGKGKGKYVEPDDSTDDSLSEEEFDKILEELSEDDDDDDDDDEEEKNDGGEEKNDSSGEEENGSREVKWGPPSKKEKYRPQVHLVTQLGQPGGSGLSAAAKQGLGTSSAKSGRGKTVKDKKAKTGEKGKLEPLMELEEDGSADFKTRNPRTGRPLAVDDAEMAPVETPEPAEMHPGSPAACESPADRLSYLKSLSRNGHYRELLDMVDKSEVR